ncbi:hypothetical protein SOPP22_17070 [Shewanella sp. OPT22]|nr:hypothetical protein SOPP22_17070 [Shewanella sp. OPT22]
MIEALLLASSYWVDINSKRALVCDINQIQHCLKALPQSALDHLPPKLHRYREMMGLRHAMVIPLQAPKTSGLILINPSETPTEAFAIVRNKPLKLHLNQQRQLSLWHEEGHLFNNDLPQRFRPKNQFQHEWQADLYLLWRSVKETQRTDLAWQQFHRRNIDVINDPINLNHWSSPILLQVLSQYSAQHINSFKSYSEFIHAVHPHVHELEGDDKQETYNLIRFLFDDNSTRDLPNYLYWRRPKLAQFLYPTFDYLLGQNKANELIKKLHLPSQNPNQ